MYNYKELKIWEMAMEVATDVYKLCKNMPSDEKYGIISQVKRSSVSIPSNIVEGAGRNTKNEFSRFLDISNGSNYELETQLLLIKKLFGTDADSIVEKLQSIQKMTYALKNTLKK
ncbi:MAG: four helix bundle protein [Crocinitomicaceae bacterium]